ncbi:hypothetical protein EYF80_001150 [Liparis tanakae]|uniref:Uncharacterized protein n=1 Tax=Liparis tanakae TaxID=230148 RepID=A0A4Z2JFH7_9TELE|nr:hypothetical protein EYF80_001150 [Liparis tanakae]
MYTFTPGPATEYSCPGKWRGPEQSQTLILPAVKFTPNHTVEREASALVLFDNCMGPPLKEAQSLVSALIRDRLAAQMAELDL